MVKSFSKTLTFLVMVFFITVSTSWATYMADITYDYTGAGGSYTFDFTVNNISDSGDTGGLDFFQIDFDADDIALYSNVTWVSDNSWFSDVWPYDSSFGGSPAGVFADDSVFGSGGGGIAQGGSLGGFQVSFDYSGSFAPEDLSFFWYANFGTSDFDNGGIDLGGYWVLGEADGTTRYVPGHVPPIPEPATMILFGLGLLGLAGVSRKK